MDRLATLAAFLLVGGLASFRLTWLVVRDDFPPVLKIRDVLAGGWRPLTRKELHVYGDFITSIGTDDELPRPFVTTKIDDEEQRWVDKASWSPWWLGDLVTCHWCASFWITLVLVLPTWAFVSVPLPALTFLATWAIACLICERVAQSQE